LLEGAVGGIGFEAEGSPSRSPKKKGNTKRAPTKDSNAYEDKINELKKK